MKKIARKVIKSHQKTDEIDAIQAKAYIPVSGIVYRMDETKFNYNKDADEWTCQHGNVST